MYLSRQRCIGVQKAAAVVQSVLVGSLTVELVTIGSVRLTIATTYSYHDIITAM